jgi:hypothetical protein
LHTYQSAAGFLESVVYFGSQVAYLFVGVLIGLIYRFTLGLRSADIPASCSRGQQKNDHKKRKDGLLPTEDDQIFHFFSSEREDISLWPGKVSGRIRLSLLPSTPRPSSSPNFHDVNITSKANP